MQNEGENNYIGCNSAMFVKYLSIYKCAFCMTALKTEIQNKNIYDDEMPELHYENLKNKKKIAIF